MTSGIRKIVFFFVLMGVSFIAYRYMIKPANKHLAKQRARVHSKLDKLTQLEQATATVKDLSKELEQLEEAIQFFESKLPPTEQIDQVLQDVTLIGQKQGVKRKMIRRLTTTEDNYGYVEQPLAMKLEGNFNSFYSFLLALEKLPRIMKVRQLKLEKAKNEEGKVTADFVVSIFFQDKTG